jgi:hypothetical protein
MADDPDVQVCRRGTGYTRPERASMCLSSGDPSRPDPGRLLTDAGPCDLNHTMRPGQASGTSNREGAIEFSGGARPRAAAGAVFRGAEFVGQMVKDVGPDGELARFARRWWRANGKPYVSDAFPVDSARV